MHSAQERQRRRHHSSVISQQVYRYQVVCRLGTLPTGMHVLSASKILVASMKEKKKKRTLNQGKLST